MSLHPGGSARRGTLQHRACPLRVSRPVLWQQIQACSVFPAWRRSCGSPRTWCFAATVGTASLCGQAGWGIPGCVHSSIGRDTCVRVVLHATCWLCLFLGESRHGAASRGGAWDDGCTGVGCRPSLTPLTRGVEEHRGAHGIPVHILAIT